ncbi:unspecified product [Leptomonas pyrrhocoris]|uniref:Unspecified product n=1 Tax=Leptomonas pyrrhocoris TaxID=157538 RepID=A0A0M9FPR3_LEPPY|nr:unspecified product [Leptomonas pyrrhocoris]KPA73376.1 unspecified product [Leptomonas pyrrhocoris]|eukprot:XP_015651815.1 unspecified product [Leptomonas pyrrhocoris]
MSRFGESVVDLLWAAGEGVIDRLKFLSRSLVEDDEYVLVFLLFLGVPAIVAMGLIARVIRRTHDRVRYAAEYEEQDADAFTTSSSSAARSSSSSSSSSSEDEDECGATAARRYTMEEIATAARQLTEQETLQRRKARRAAAEAEAEAVTLEVTAAAAAEPPSASASAPEPAAPAEVSDRKETAKAEKAAVREAQTS